jgi:hypothetical protein
MLWIAAPAWVDPVQGRRGRCAALGGRITSAERRFSQDVPIRIRRHEIARTVPVCSLQTEDKPAFAVKTLLLGRMQSVRGDPKAQLPYSLFRHHSFRYQPSSNTHCSVAYVSRCARRSSRVLPPTNAVRRDPWRAAQVLTGEYPSLSRLLNRTGHRLIAKGPDEPGFAPSAGVYSVS